MDGSEGGSSHEGVEVMENLAFCSPTTSLLLPSGALMFTHCTKITGPRTRSVIIKHSSMMPSTPGHGRATRVIMTLDYRTTIGQLFERYFISGYSFFCLRPDASWQLEYLNTDDAMPPVSVVSRYWISSWLVFNQHASVHPSLKTEFRKAQDHNPVSVDWRIFQTVLVSPSDWNSSSIRYRSRLVKLADRAYESSTEIPSTTQPSTKQGHVQLSSSPVG